MLWDVLLVKVMRDRSCYHYRIERAITFKDCLSLVVDGAEMSRYGLPYFCQSDKLTSEGRYPLIRSFTLLARCESALLLP